MEYLSKALTFIRVVHCYFPQFLISNRSHLTDDQRTHAHIPETPLHAEMSL